jgi:GntR family transcriptional regulator
MPISHESQPLYHRVCRQIADDIQASDLRPGDRLPSERSLCDGLGVSRATVRRAIEELVAEGLVEQRGRGTFVASQALTEPRNTLMSLSELARSRGLEPTAQVLVAQTRSATLDEADRFGIAPGAAVFDLQRCRMLDGMPIAVDSDLVPLSLAPSLGELDFTTASLYSALEEEGIRLARADYDIEARGADEQEAELLELAPGAPVLQTRTVALDGGGRVIDMGRSVYRADRYRFQATLTRRAQRDGERSHEEAPGQRGRGLRPGNGRRRVRRDAGAEQAHGHGGVASAGQD